MEEKNEGKAPVLDCVLVRGGQDASPDLRAWREALPQAGLLADEASAAELESARLSDGFLESGGRLYSSVVLAGLRRISASLLDTLTAFILMGGRLAASGPAFSGPEAVTGREGRSEGAVRSQLRTLERYTSRTEPDDVIDAALALQALPGVRSGRPALRGPGPLPERAVFRSRGAGPARWRLELEAPRGFEGRLALPCPASRLAWAAEGGAACEAGSAAGPVLEVALAPGFRGRLEVEEGLPPAAYPMRAGASPWFAEEPGALPRALRSDRDWAECSSGEPKGGEPRLLRFRLAFADADVPAVPEGGTLRADLSASEGGIAVLLNGVRLLPAEGAPRLFSVPLRLFAQSNELVIEARPEKGGEGAGPFAEPLWQVYPESDLACLALKAL